MSYAHLSKSERRRSLFAIFFVAALDNFGFAVVFSLFAPLILNPDYGMLPPDASAHFKNWILGLCFFVFPLTQFFGAPLLGDYADRFGRKKAFYVTIIGTTLGYALSAIAIHAHSISILVISRFLTGFFAGNLSICLASIADLSPDEKSRAWNYGLVSVFWGFTWPLAMLTGGYLSDSSIVSFFNAALPFWVTVVFSLLSLIAVYVFLIETHVGEKKVKIEILKAFEDVKIALRTPSMRPFFIVLFVWTMGWGVTTQWYGAFGIEQFKISQQAISWGLIFQGVFWVFGASAINPLILRRFSTWTAAFCGIFFSSFFVFGSVFGSTFWSFSFIYWIAAIGAAFGMSNALNLISLSAPPRMQGRAMGLSQSMMSLGWIVVPFIGTSLGNINVRFYYMAAGLLLFFSSAILFFFRRYGKRKHQ